jgi:cyclase
LEQLTKNVFVETNVRGCDPGFVVTSHGIVMIDVPIDIDHAKTWAEAIHTRGQVRCIINTEHHMDHWFGNTIFSTGTVLSHEAAREAMLAMDVEYIRERSHVLYSDPLTIPDNYQLTFPNITYSEHMTYYSGSHTFHLIHTPGHTPGQTAVYIPEEEVVFTGDAVFCENWTAVHDGAPEQWLDSLRMIENLDVRFIVPGHGRICGKEYLKTQAAVVRGYREAGEKLQAQGRSKHGIDDAVKRSIDPYFDIKDVGMRAGIVLPPNRR